MEQGPAPSLLCPETPSAFFTPLTPGILNWILNHIGNTKHLLKEYYHAGSFVELEAALRHQLFPFSDNFFQQQS